MRCTIGGVGGRGTFGELAVRVAAAALLSFLHTVAAQETNPTSQIQATSGEMDGLVRQVLADRIAANDIPSLNIARGTKRITVLSDPVRLPISKDALPAIDGYDFRLITAEEAQAESDKTKLFVYFIAIERLQIQGDTASLWIGMDFTMPSDSKLAKMCCCSRPLDYRRADDRWVFVRWDELYRCY